MLHYGFKYRENLNDYQYWFEREAMPRLSRQQREQAIGWLHAGQAARVIANDFNCSTRTIERLRQRYNATNSTNDRPRSGRPEVTTTRQNQYILRQHLNDRIARASETARHTVGTHQRLVGWDLTTSDVVVPTEVLSLQKDTVRHVSNGPYTGKTGEIDNSGMWSSPTKSDNAFQPLMDEHEFGEGRVSAIMRTVWWKLIRWAVQASWCGAVLAWIQNLVLLSSKILVQAEEMV